MSEPKFTWNDLVAAVTGASTSKWTSSSASIVGITAEETRSGYFLEKYPTGFVYTIEFEDGSSTTVPEGDKIHK